jgi:hypothetical protein
MTKNSAQDPDRENRPAPRRKRRRPQLTNNQLIQIFGITVTLIIALTR